MTTQSSIQVQPDSTGKLVGSIIVQRADGSLVHRQEIVLADGEYDFRVKVMPTGELQVVSLTQQDYLYYIAQQLDCIRRAANILAGKEFLPQDVVVS